jgi:DNA-binding XRE family transcriptional regulator
MDWGWIHHCDGHYFNFYHQDRGNVRSPAPKTPLGWGIRLRRETLAMTQDELARRIGMSSTQISHIELGKCQPRAITRAKINRALAMTTE